MDRLDETDERILAELAEHARATFAEIGQRVNLSAPAVKRRVDRMLDSGVIRGFTTVVDRNALGWNTEAYVQVFCHGTIAPDELRAGVGRHPGGGQCGDGHGHRRRDAARARPRHAPPRGGARTHPVERGHRTQREHRGAVEHHRAHRRLTTLNCRVAHIRPRPSCRKPHVSTSWGHRHRRRRAGGGQDR